MIRGYCVAFTTLRGSTHGKDGGGGGTNTSRSPLSALLYRIHHITQGGKDYGIFLLKIKYFLKFFFASGAYCRIFPRPHSGLRSVFLLLLLLPLFPSCVMESHGKKRRGRGKEGGIVMWKPHERTTATHKKRRQKEPKGKRIRRRLEEEEEEEAY